MSFRKWRATHRDAQQMQPTDLPGLPSNAVLALTSDSPIITGLYVNCLYLCFRPGKATFTVNSRPAEQQTVSETAKQEARMIPEQDATVSFYPGVCSCVRPQQGERPAAEPPLQNYATPASIIPVQSRLTMSGKSIANRQPLNQAHAQRATDTLGDFGSEEHDRLSFHCQ